MGKKNEPNKKSNHCDAKFKNISQSKKEIYLECEKLLEICSNPFKTNCTWEDYLEISNILEKIKNLQKLNISSVTRLDVNKEFIDWLIENEAVIDGLKIHNYANYGLGLQAKKSFKENELILKIPNKIIFNVFTAGSEIKDIENDTLVQHMPQVALAIALLIEKRKDNSKWKSYLNILPRNYNTVLYMSVNDMKELKGCNVFHSALKHCKNIARQYAYFFKLFQNSKNSISSLLKDCFTYDDYRWAVSTVMTRQNIIPYNKKSQTVHCLIPMWDMCNHQEGKITTNFNDLSNSCECYAMKNFDSGSQIFIYYGPRSNSEFFLHSGFICNENVNDSFKLQLGVSKSDPLEKKRVQLLSKIKIPAIHEYFVNLQPISGSLLGFLRVFNMNENELDYWLKSDATDKILNHDYLIGKDLDYKVQTYATTRLKLLLRNYPQTIEEQQKNIDTCSQPCKKLIMQLILSEKMMLQNIIKTLEKC